MPEKREIAALHEILRSFRHDSPKPQLLAHGPQFAMSFSLVHRWNVATGTSHSLLPTLDLDTLEEGDEQALDNDDPLAILIRERKAEKQLRQASEQVIEKRELKVRTEQQKQQDEEDRRRREWLASEQYRQAIEAFSADLDDAGEAIRKSRAQAIVAQEQERKTLEKAQQNALVVDGSRVYFTRDGSRLYGEDNQQITNAATLAAAQQQRSAKPGATSYEEYAARFEASRLLAEKIKQLDEAGNKLGELDRRIKKGGLSSEELAQARQDKQDLIDALPADARAEYERRHQIRSDEQKLAYHAADPAFLSAPDLSTQFRQSVAATVDAAQQPVKPEPQERPALAYKAAPEY